MADQKPNLIVIVDTEEEFDWNKPFQRTNRDVSHIDNLLLAQDIFDEFGVKVVYACTHPVLETPSSRMIMERLIEDHDALIGTHLHPWVTPPFDEELSEENSFPGNLPYDLEAAKIQHMTQLVTDLIGQHPRIYFAGRYGLGQNTYKILQEQGYLIDVSIAPPQNYSYRKGPDYSHSPNKPFWLEKRDGLYCIPTTGGVLGAFSNLSNARAINRFVRHPFLQALHIPGVLSGLGLLDAVRLTPEGNDLSDMKRLTNTLLQRGIRTFAMNFHSPSLGVGHTPYAQTLQERNDLLTRLRSYFAYFKHDIGGDFIDPLQQRKNALQSGEGDVLPSETLFKPWRKS
jgi:hypothetical protein